MRKIGGKPLCAWSLERLRDAAERCGVDSAAVICPEEEPLMDVAGYLGVSILARPLSSAVSDDFETIYDSAWVQSLRDAYDWILLANAGLPFVPGSSYCRFIELAKTESRPFISAFCHRGYVWDEEEKPLLPITQPLDTRSSSRYLVPSHCFYGFPSPLFGTPESYSSLRPIEVPYDLRHRTDIDTLDDLTLARAIHSSGLVA